MAPNVTILHEIGKMKNLEQRLSMTEDMVQRQNSLVIELISKLEELRSENGVRKVTFSASLLASGKGHTGTYVSVSSPLIYKKVFTNIENGYNSDTGIFTAPVKGVYYFRFYAHCHVGTKMAVSPYKNGSLHCLVFSYEPVTNGNRILLTLEKGDQIYTELWDKTWVFDGP
ncbi:collagen alpha-1(X) chain-like [Neoarius graeffei]|uniref:collagen alpha-1(X) chain-like n=1 Tax=Neoarius graeffei TaxID=443677 RepID=UPI00298D3903|nr:collagen alpha-1(X) chain-like [Neoarius graeffei]